MTKGEAIEKILGQVEAISKDFVNLRPCPIYATVKFEKNHNTVVFAANEEGLVYFASILLSLAKNRVDNSHFHFDSGTVLNVADLDLVIKYEKASWEPKEAGEAKDEARRK